VRVSILVLALSLFLPGSFCFGGGGTVCLVTIVSGDEAIPETALLRSRIEDGFMDLLYENGFIVFNCAAGETQDAVRLAEEGGAGFLVSVSVEVVREGGSVRIRSVGFSGTNLVSCTPFLADSLSPDSETDPVGDPGFCRSIGKKVAERLLRVLDRR
jgi:hypothetical protein